jgi:hypothetical protein
VSRHVYVCAEINNGNIGYPGEPDEIEHFMSMLGTTHKNLTATDLEKLKKSLVDAGAKLKAAMPTRPVPTSPADARR